ncbi:hypothetical protein BH11PSE10_BH11PSE10_06060 [soil metagenome]
MSSQVAILAGGGGTRLRERSGGMPKPMVAIAGRPLLERQIEQCRDAGLTRIALLLHFGHELIEAHFGDGSRFGVTLDHCIERSARGTAGALADALERLDDHFLVIYGDTCFDIDLAAFMRAHARHGADATLLLHPNDHPHDSDLVEIDESGRVLALWSYPHPAAREQRNLVNAGLYAMRRASLVALVAPDQPSDLAKHAFPAMLAAGRPIQGVASVEYIKDMGTPARLDQVEADFAHGLPERLSARHLRSAVFMDRDGTLNEEVNHLAHAEQMRLHAGVGAAVRSLNRSGTLTVVVTNQPVIARGELTNEGLDKIHARLDALLGAEGAYLDRVYHCPHHPQRGFAGEVAALKIECICRKPATGMVDRACSELAIDRTRSWMVGDTTSDIALGQRAGLKTVLVRTGHAGGDAKYENRPDYVMGDLAEAVRWILLGHRAAVRRLLPIVAQAAQSRLVLVAGQSRSGKTTAAQLLAEALAGLGRTSHVVSLDGWLRPPMERPEGAGVLARFDLRRAAIELALVVEARSHQSVRWPVHDRAARTLRDGPAQLIAPDDLLIVEGVPALMDEGLCELAGLRLQIEVSESVRRQRFDADYRCRGRSEAEIEALYAARLLDEVPAVEAAARRADTRISLEGAT